MVKIFDKKLFKNKIGEVKLALTSIGIYDKKTGFHKKYSDSMREIYHKYKNSDIFLLYNSWNLQYINILKAIAKKNNYDYDDLYITTKKSIEQNIELYKYSSENGHSVQEAEQTLMSYIHELEKLENESEVADEKIDDIKIDDEDEKIDDVSEEKIEVDDIKIDNIKIDNISDEKIDNEKIDDISEEKIEVKEEKKDTIKINKISNG